MASDWITNQQEKLRKIGEKIGINIEISNRDERQYLPRPPEEKPKTEDIITYPDALVLDKKEKVLGVIEIDGNIGPKKLLGDIFTTDFALKIEENKVTEPFLIIGIPNRKKGSSIKKLEEIVDYSKEKCDVLVDIQLCLLDPYPNLENDEFLKIIKEKL